MTNPSHMADTARLHEQHTIKTCPVHIPVLGLVVGLVPRACCTDTVLMTAATRRRLRCGCISSSSASHAWLSSGSSSAPSHHIHTSQHSMGTCDAMLLTRAHQMTRPYPPPACFRVRTCHLRFLCTCIFLLLHLHSRSFSLRYTHHMRQSNAAPV